MHSPGGDLETYDSNAYEKRPAQKTVRSQADQLSSFSDRCFGSFEHPNNA